MDIMFVISANHNSLGCEQPSGLDVTLTRGSMCRVRFAQYIPGMISGVVMYTNGAFLDSKPVYRGVFISCRIHCLPYYI